MRFPCVFSRYIGSGLPSGAILLGADTAPTVTPPQSGADNHLSSRFSNAAGWTAQRLVLAYAYKGAAAPPQDLVVQVYFFEERLQRWFTNSAAKITLVEGVLGYVRIPGCYEAPATRQNVLANNASPSSLDVLLVADALVSPDDGEYRLGISLDLAGF